MGFFKNMLKRYSEPLKFKLPESGPTLTAVSGGMGTTELLIRLEMVLDDIKSKKPIIDHAYELAGFSHNLQSRLLADLGEIADISYEHGYEFLTVSAVAISAMEPIQYDKWIYDIKALLNDGYHDKASELIKQHPSYIEAPHIVSLHTITEKLEKIIYSIYQKDIPVLVAEQIPNHNSNKTAYTDGFQIFLPEKISLFDTAEDNFKLYKIQTFHLLFQIEWSHPDKLKIITDGITRHGQKYLSLLGKIETLRIDKTIKHTYPGLWSDIEHLNTITDTPHLLNDITFLLFKNVNRIHASRGTFSNDRLNTIDDSLQLTEQYIDNSPSLSEHVYQPIFLPQIINYAHKNPSNTNTNENPEIQNKRANKHDEDKTLVELSRQINIDDQLDTDKQIEDILSCDEYDSESLPTKPENAINSEQKLTKQKDAFYYKEWDTSLQKYRKDWCKVEEIAENKLVNNNDIEINPQLKHIESRIKKSLDLLINEQRLMRFQSDGDAIDIDAWVAARSNKNKNADDYQNLYIRSNKNMRNVAIMFAADISGSTRGWKSTAIKDTTSILCKTLARLDDQYAVYAFSGSGRNNCQIYPIKRFTENNNKTVQERIFSMKPQQYTRMGAAVRHMSSVLSETPAKTRILFLLTDGRPDDIDSYRGKYAIEDTRRALNEAKAQQLNPFVLTFDKEGMDYLPHMLGSNRYQLISDVAQLPVQISTIYKHLTS